MDKFSHSFFDICTSFANETTLRIFFNKGTATYRELLDGEVDKRLGIRIRDLHFQVPRSCQLDNHRSINYVTVVQL